MGNLEQSRRARLRKLLRKAGLTLKETPFSSVGFPVVRRVFPSLIAQEIVSVQPMSLPSGLLFYTGCTFGAEPKKTEAK